MSNITIEQLEPDLSRRLEQRAAQHGRTSITKAEILYGIAILPEGKRSRMLRESAQAMFREDFAQQMLNFDEQAASCFAEIAAHRKSVDL